MKEKAPTETIENTIAFDPELEAKLVALAIQQEGMLEAMMNQRDPELEMKLAALAAEQEALMEEYLSNAE
jgi:hypothetical protein